MVRGILAASAVAVLGSVPLAAQDKSNVQEVTIPASALPPEGMCRLWLKDVPEKRQPAPTDCATAIRTRPRDAVLLLGDPSRNAKLPPRTASGPVTQMRSDDPFGRLNRGGVSTLDRLMQQQIRQQTQPQRTATQNVAPRGATAAAPAGGAAAIKAPETKPAAIKPPE